MIIRQFRDTDAKDVSELIIDCLQKINAKFYPEFVIDHMVKLYTPEKLIEMSDHQMVLVADQFDEIIGSATINKNYFGSVFIKAKFQKMGVGKKLMGTLEKLAKESGIEIVMLHASINAVKFYEKIGYIRGDLVSDDKFGTSYEMSKKLK